MWFLFKSIAPSDNPLDSFQNNTDKILQHLLPLSSDGVNSDQILVRMSSILTINDHICSVWFSIELLFRIVFCPNKRQFLRTWLNIVDLLAVIPFYIQTVFHLLSIDKSQNFLRLEIWNVFSGDHVRVTFSELQANYGMVFSPTFDLYTLYVNLMKIL